MLFNVIAQNIGTIFGHPMIVVLGVILAYYLGFGISLIMILLTMIIVSIVRYGFFYFWNYERIKHLSLKEGWMFFIQFQKWQIVLIPLYAFAYLQITPYEASITIVVGYLMIFLIFLALCVFIYMQTKLYKYDKFNLKMEEK